MKAETPLLSVVTITYNHEAFIAKMIEGVLLQLTTFPIEFIIAEDCSTDKTREIISEYAYKYPELIKFIKSDTNIGAVANERRALQQANGKYIAFCEGDDYWTDPLKLQKQVDFLEQNSDYSVCFHRCINYDIEKDIWIEDQCDLLFDKNDLQAVDLTTNMFFNRWITMPLTMVYRKDAFDLNIALKYKYYRDMHLIYHLLMMGKGYIFSFVGGVRIVHQGGMHSKINLQSQCEIAVEVSKEMFIQNKSDKILKTNFLRSLDWSINSFAENHFNNYKVLKYILERFYYSFSVKTLLKNILLITKQ